MIILLDIFHFPLAEPVAIFFLVLLIILLTPLIFNRLRIPYIVGLILAGMLVGPYGLNILEHDASFAIFGEVGILYLMFLAGVEIDMFHLRKNFRQGILFGLLSFAIPMAAGILASRFLLEADWLSSTLIASMFASHTLISYPIVARLGLSKSRGAIIAVCGTIVAVLLALVVLAEVVDIRQRGGFSVATALWLPVKLVIYILFFGFLTPRVTRMFFRRFTDSVTLFIYVLATVFLFSLVAELIGIAAILGAFYAGLVLNRHIPGRSPLMNRIEFVGNAIFIPYFLIGVGMLINVGVIFRGWSVAWVASVMILTALASKWLAAWISGISVNLKGVERRLVFGLSSGKAAATIAATMIGYESGMLSEDILNGSVLMIFACCLVASVTTQRSALTMRMELTEGELLNGDSEKVKMARQLVAVSNPVTAEGIMKMAVMMRSEKNRQPVNLLFVRNSDDKTVIEMGRAALRLAADVAVAVDLEVKEVERFDMNVMSGMVGVMKELDCTDIFIGLHRKSNVVDSFFGKMTEQLLRATNKMVIMNRCFIPPDTIRKVMVAVPAKAEYETGFRLWLTRVGNLASQLGCHVDFAAYAETIPYIEALIRDSGFAFRYECHEMSSWDDFIVLSSRVTEEDLLVFVSARRASISFSSDLETMPEYLSRYFSTYNLMVIYPDQFGDEVIATVPADVLNQSPETEPGVRIFSPGRWTEVYHRIRNAVHKNREHFNDRS